MSAITFTGSIAVALGSENTYILADEKASVFSCASAVLVDAVRPSDIYAVGDDAKRMEGRAGEETALVSPIAYGGVADTELTAVLILGAIEKAGLKHRPIEKSRLVLTVPEGSTRVERAALANAAKLTGAKRVLVVKSPLASAVQMSRHVDKAEAQAVVSIGANVTEVTVISSYGIVLNRHEKTGSAAFDEAIIQHIRTTHGLVISRTVAAQLKKELGSAVKMQLEGMQSLNGRDIRTGRPVTACISSDDISDALSSPISSLVNVICDALYNIPPEFSNDILRNGICLTGGGSEVFALSQRLREETKLDVVQTDEPRFDAVRGALKIAQDERTLRAAMNAYSAYEV